MKIYIYKIHLLKHHCFITIFNKHTMFTDMMTYDYWNHISLNFYLSSHALWSAKYIMNKSITRFHWISNLIEMSLVNSCPIWFQPGSGTAWHLSNMIPARFWYSMAPVQSDSSQVLVQHGTCPIWFQPGSGTAWHLSNLIPARFWHSMAHLQGCTHEVAYKMQSNRKS